MINLPMIAWLFSGSAVAWLASMQQFSMPALLAMLVSAVAAIGVFRLIRRQQAQ
jgi:hypothetical protein